MSPLAEALLAAQRRSLATLEKAYVADLIDKEELTRQMSLIGLADTMDGAFLLASLDVLKEWGVAAPTMTERVARENGEPKKATEGQVKYALDLTGVDEERDRRESRYDHGGADSPREGTEA